MRNNFDDIFEKMNEADAAEAAAEAAKVNELCKDEGEPGRDARGEKPKHYPANKDEDMEEGAYEAKSNEDKGMRGYQGPDGDRGGNSEKPMVGPKGEPGYQGADGDRGGRKDKSMSGPKGADGDASEAVVDEKEFSGPKNDVQNKRLLKTLDHGKGKASETRVIAPNKKVEGTMGTKSEHHAAPNLKKLDKAPGGKMEKVSGKGVAEGYGSYGYVDDDKADKVDPMTEEGYEAVDPLKEDEGRPALEEIMDSMENGQFRQLASQMTEYGPNVWEDVTIHMDEMGMGDDQKYSSLKRMIMSHFNYAM